jgi:hypothetical protein
MLWLKAVIARLLGLQTRPLDSHAQPTQTVGRVSPVRTQQHGSQLSAHPTSAKTGLKRKPKRAPSTTQASSRKQELSSAGQTPIPRGQQAQTPVSKTPRPVKSAVKAKSARAKQTTQAQSQKQEQALAQTPTARHSGVRGRPRKTVA